MPRYNFRFKATKFHRGVGKLLDKESAQELIEELKKVYELNTDQESLKFKTPSFKYTKNLKVEDFKRIKTYSHVITINYGKQPIWLLWLTTIDGLQYSFYVNVMTQQVIWSKHRFAPRLYKGTVFEGEIIDTDFVISDLLVYKNQWYKGNLYMKMAIIKDIMVHHYQLDPLIENVDLRVKIYVEYEYLKSYVTDVVGKDPQAQGILFVPVDKSVKIYSVLFRYADKLQLPERAEKSTLDKDQLNPIEIPIEEISKDDDFRSQEQVFWLARDRQILDNYYLYSINRDVLVQHELAVITGLQKTRWLKQYFKEDQDKEPNQKKSRKHSGVGPLLQFTCQFRKKFQLWEPVALV